MIRSITVATIVAALASGCGNDKGSGSGSSASETSAAGPTDADLDTMLEDMFAYTEQIVPIMIKFDGDCAAQAKRMLVLEPLAQKIRKTGALVDADPARAAAFKTRMAAKKAEVLGRLDVAIKKLGTTKAELDRIESELKNKCKDDPAWVDAMDHVGLRKKS